MKIRLSLLTLASVVALGLVARAAEPETELGTKMEKVGGDFRAVRRNVNDASKNADTLERLGRIKENLQASLKLEPAKKAEVPAAEQKKFLADYQAEMKRFIALVEKAETALKANNNEEAAKLVNAMGEDQKKAHKAFKKDDKKK